MGLTVHHSQGHAPCAIARECGATIPSHDFMRLQFALASRSLVVTARLMRIPPEPLPTLLAAVDEAHTPADTGSTHN